MKFEEVKISDLCDIKRISVSPIGGVRYFLYSFSAFDNNKKPELIDGSEIKSSKFKVLPNSILFNKLNVKFLRVWSIGDNIEANSICSTEFIPLLPKESVSKEYLYYILTEKNFTYRMHSLRRGTSSSQQRISPESLMNYVVRIPNKENQLRIAKILANLDNKIALNNAINHNLEQQAQIIFKQYFPYSVSDRLPNGWRVGTIGEIIQIHDSKRIPLSGAERMKMKKIYPYYGAASLMDYVDDFIFDGKYLLLGEDGTVVDEAGYPILQYVWGRFWVNNHAHILTGKLGYNVESLYILFKQTPVKSIVTGAVQPKISQANLCSIQVVIPPVKLLTEYNNIIEPLFKQLRVNNEEVKSLATLRDTLLPKLMSGEIDVSDVEI